MGWLCYTWIVLAVRYRRFHPMKHERLPLGQAAWVTFVTGESHRRFIQPKVNAYVHLDDCTVKMLAFLSGL